MRGRAAILVTLLLAPALAAPAAITVTDVGFRVPARLPILEENGDYPCSDCHDGVDPAPNPERRQLEEEHEDLEFDHGEGRFWCLACHDLENRDVLRSLEGEPISFDRSYELCGQCHFQRRRDLGFGAHGKRLSGWTTRPPIRQTCVGCHDPHAPRIPPRRPEPPPKPRTGFPSPRRPIAHRPLAPWEAILLGRGFPAEPGARRPDAEAADTRLEGNEP